jgi:hypothetical protein
VNEEGVGVGDRQADDVYESDGLTSLEYTDSDGIKRKKYKQFNEKHNLKISIMLVIGNQFTNTYSFKRTLKTFAVQNGFDYYYMYNDMGRVSVVCREQKEKNCK